MPGGGVLEVAIIAMLIGSAILHEVTHGWVALALGDDTAKRAHRLSLNPLDHLDPIGSVLVPAVLVLSHAGVFFAWAKPVPVNVNRLRHPRNDAVVVGLAGPACNLVLVCVAAGVMRLLHPLAVAPTFLNPSGVYTWPFLLLWYFGFLNILLCCFNLIPIPPLDGSSVLERLIPQRHLGSYYAVRPFAMLVVFAFVLFARNTAGEAAVYNFLASHWSTFAGYPANI